MSDSFQVSGIEIDISVLRGKDLVAKDRNIFNKKTTSDPYVTIVLDGRTVGTTQIIPKNLNPEWNETFKLNLSTEESNRIITKIKNGDSPQLMFHIYDHDKGSSDDSMGVAKGIISLDPPSTKWMKVEIAPGFTKPVTGELEVKIAVSVRKMLTPERGNSLSLNGGTVDVVLDWKIENGQVIDLDTSCVAVAPDGKILMDETVYFGDLMNSNGSIRHSGDARHGGGKGEVITCRLDQIRSRVQALYFILTIATPDKSFESVKSASISVKDQNKCTLFNFTPSLVGDHTAMFLMRISRKRGYGWAMTVIEDTDHTARDFGSLIPEIKGYCRDFAPNIVVDPHERIAIMRKGGAIRLRNYISPNVQVTNKVTFGLTWDITNGRNVDLDASAICLDSNLRPLDTVYFAKKRSFDNAIIHGGDELTGDKEGDDETIHLHLDRLDPSVAHIGFVINSYSGEELDDVSRASCHLFDSETKIDIASYTLSNNSALDKRTGVVMASLYRESDGSWCMRIISEAANGTMAKDLIGDLQEFLRNTPAPKVQEVPEAEIIVNIMPEEVEIVVDPIVPMHKVANNIFVPPAAPTANA
jgi:tellurium resistance protein TerZ